ncbi:MAG TPA: hypothetical protein VFN74_06265, partial [Chloroflexota bacterium]|nr:hypothetical protein [Chloroflexota bacterium]
GNGGRPAAERVAGRTVSHHRAPPGTTIPVAARYATEPALLADWSRRLARPEDAVLHLALDAPPPDVVPLECGVGQRRERIDSAAHVSTSPQQAG